MKRSVIVDAEPAVVRGNPWQVRGLDEELVGELEAVIRESGFRGVLVGRAMRAGEVWAGQVGTEIRGLADRLPDRALERHLMEEVEMGQVLIQLAWGHHRLEAARWAGVETVPVEVVAGLTDEEMASWALMENVRRRDLSAVEEARAIQRLVEEFGWDQARVAEALGYGSKATVSNKLRLLRLPEAVQEKVVAGELAERKARQLVTLAGVSEKRAVALVEEGRITDYDVKSALRLATKPLAGGLRLRAPWPMDWTPSPSPSSASGEGGWVTCEVCEEQVRVGGDEVRCKKPRCWNKRRRLWEAQVVAGRSKETGIPVLEEGEKGITFTWRQQNGGWRMENGEWQMLRDRCMDREGYPAVAPLGLRLCPFLRLKYRWGEVVEVCGGGEEYDKCVAVEEEQAQEGQREEEERTERCRAVLRRGAEALARELEGVPDLVMALIGGGMKSGGRWKEMPADLTWNRVGVAWSAVVGAIDIFSSYRAPPEEDDLVDKVREVLGAVGVKDFCVDRRGGGVV